MSTLFTARKRREKIIQLAIKARSQKENRERLYKWINTGLEVATYQSYDYFIFQRNKDISESKLASE